AGEVIERPASVIKELVENSIDAGAKRITIEIKNGGITYMRVTDDGAGMAYEDVPIAFLRHATSKLSTAEELENISTLGFRGEALASVTAVTRTELLTKRAADALGVSYVIEGGEEILYESTGCPDGTTIIMRDLFFNTPARLKFLKKDVTEGNYVQSVVDKLALSHPHIAFTFVRDGKTVRITAGDGKMYSAAYAVFGKQFAASLTEVDYEQNHIIVKGYISTPYACRANRQMQYFFINGRSIRNTTCMAALEEGYKNSIMTGKFPACVLDIQMPASDIDVNVSPSKTEVRFANDKMVFEAVYLAVKNGILNADNNKEITVGRSDYTNNHAASEKNSDLENIYRFSAGTNNEVKPVEKNDAKVIAGSAAGTEKTTDDVSLFDLPLKTDAAFSGTSLNSSKAIYKPIPPKNIFIQKVIDSDEAEVDVGDYQFINTSSFIKAGSEEEKNTQIPDPIVEEHYKPALRFIGELFKTYILCECGDELILIDKHAAHERIRFEKLKKEVASSSQLLTESVSLTLSAEEVTALADNVDYLERLGIDLSFKSESEIEINGFPAMLSDWPSSDTVQKISDILLVGGDNIEGLLFDDILHTAACKGAIKANEATSSRELEQLAQRIWENTSIRYCPHGRPIVTTMSKYNIERNFGRIQ
ncbi:MAG: DNA mismatch repair endonuclease MutL, partial [[Eubacterium] siraeum]|nr:DNA mismatch repair endonuclease MutL [[Eubacterium] siraeum]